MATVGDQLTTPEQGWKRYDQTTPILKYPNSYNLHSRSGLYNGSQYQSTYAGYYYYGFDFIGTKVRIIESYGPNRCRDVKVEIDGTIETYNNYAQSDKFQCIVYEKIGLENKRHTVRIYKDVDDGTYLSSDAIDIDAEGCLLHPDEVISIDDLEVGKRIRCHYSTFISGQYGVFSNLGEETYKDGINDFLPSIPTATPDGDFYFIMVEDWNGKKRVIADRNLQNNISWDTLNNIGLVFGLTKTEIYVDASNGNDENDGSRESPLKTLKAVLDKAPPQSDVIMRDGVYQINDGTGYLHALVNNKNLTYIGNGINTIIEVLACPTAYSQSSNTSAIFKNLVIRPSDSITGDERVIWYNIDGAKAKFAQFKNVLFTKSPNGQYPTNALFYFGSSVGTSNYPFYFENCTFGMTFLNSATNTGYPYLMNNCSLSQSALNKSGIRNNCEYGVVFDENYHNINGNNSGIYSGKNSWLTFKHSNKFETNLRLMTGGVTGTNGGSSSDKNNEWDKYIVNSDLNGTITDGDDDVWHWSVNQSSWTSTTNSTVDNVHRVVRGRSTLSTPEYYYTNDSNTLSSSANGYCSYRPILEIEKLTDFKILIQEGNFIKKWADDQWETVSEEPLEESLFDQVDEGLPPAEAFNQLADQFEIYVQTELSSYDDELSIKAIPKAVIVTPTKDISIRSVETIDSFTLNANIDGQGVVKVAVSFDRGNTWHTRKNNAWSEISLEVSTMQIDGMDPTTLNAITSTEWSQLRGASETIRFAYLLSKENESDILEVQDLVSQMDMKGTWKKAVHGSHYDYEYPNNDELLVTIFEGGDYKINY